MSVGKASIKRATMATRKKVVENQTTEETVVVKEVEEAVSTEEKKNHRPVRLTEDMPTFLL